ncbi:unnamed protein product [Mesocestoides corti]|nr:unnamed protein product [Mesocestoides corti]
MRSDAEFAGRLVIKAQLHDDIRRILIHNEELTYDELILMMQRVFKPKLDGIDNFIIKYKDQDDDYVTIAEEFDLSYAIHNHKVLRLKLFVPQESTSPTEEASVEELPNHSDADVPGTCGRKAVIMELRRLRDDFNMLAEKLDNFILHQKLEPTKKSANAGDSCPTEKPELPASSNAMPPRPFASDVPPTTSHVCPPGPSATPASLASSLSQNFANVTLGQSVEPPPAFSRPSEPPTSAFRPSPSVDSTSAPPPPPLQMGGPGMSHFSQPAPTSVASPPPLSGGPAPPQPPPPPPPQHSASQQPALLPTTNLPPLSVPQAAFPSAVPSQLSAKPVPQPPAVATPPPLHPPVSQFTPMMMSTASSMVPPPPMPLPGQRFPTTTSAAAAAGGSGMSVPPPPGPGSMGFPSMGGQMSMHLGGPAPPPLQPPPPPPMQPLQLGGLPSSQFAGATPPPPPPSMFGMYGQRPPQ